jgi:hypothetical protein
MANNEKIETLFRAALDATPREREQSSDLSTGFEPADNTWEIIVKYNGLWHLFRKNILTSFYLNF